MKQSFSSVALQSAHRLSHKDCIIGLITIKGFEITKFLTNAIGHFDMRCNAWWVVGERMDSGKGNLVGRRCYVIIHFKLFLQYLISIYYSHSTDSTIRECNLYGGEIFQMWAIFASPERSLSSASPWRQTRASSPSSPTAIPHTSREADTGLVWVTRRNFISPWIFDENATRKCKN